jgi:hypothetical protein
MTPTDHQRLLFLIKHMARFMLVWGAVVAGCVFLSSAECDPQSVRR